MPEQTIKGHTISNTRIEQAYKGNYHLFAIIDGQERKFVIRQKTQDHEEISRKGISNLSVEFIMELISKYML